MIQPDLIGLWLKRIDGAEGNYSNRDPTDDPGGETKWGITKRSYPGLDIKELTLERAQDIYLRDFIRPLCKHDLSASLIFQLLDFGVNSGISSAVRYLQAELGVRSDGIIGPITQEAISKVSETDLIFLITAARIEYLTHLDNWHSNSRGWMRRMAKNLRYAAIDT